MSRVKLSDMPPEQQKGVREWLRATGAAGGAAGKGKKKSRGTAVARDAMRKRWERKEFVGDVLTQVLQSTKGISIGELRGELAGRGVYCSASHLSRTLKQLGRKGKDGQWRARK